MFIKKLVEIILKFNKMRNNLIYVEIIQVLWHFDDLFEPIIQIWLL
jgi:hypothetical protein